MNIRLKLYIVISAIFIFPNLLLTYFFVSSGFKVWEGVIPFISLCATIIGLIIVYRGVPLQPPNKLSDAFAENDTSTSRGSDTGQNTKYAVSDLSHQTVALNDRVETLVNVAGDISHGAMIQTKNVVKSTDTITEITSGIQQIASSSEKVSDTSRKASVAADEGYKLIGDLLTKMQSIYQMTDQLSKFIANLADHSGQVDQIVHTITGIAEQTRLLSFNANIEAARAGEYGKGFAVVANEIGKLSNKSKEETDHISNILSSIQSNVAKAVDMVSNSMEKVSDGMTAMNATKSYFETIIQEVSGTSDQIMEMTAAVQQLSAGTEEVKNITEFTMKVQQGGTAKITQLDTLLKEFKSSFETMKKNYSDLESGIE
ncbi:methyl-accepting chemotaxis protein [Sporolactobacillus pectinivorans]|uniref:methyl-accepting chemotaxis protein n=1 Tax=Sporolactobacillus pectinivorans TaxID=1591408 RepID=UPI000C258DD8|nr:methyl-accepting chemotaxis protein [Sporolactobacillus pectinivorans]